VLILKQQIAAAGHVLVKEYIDNGFSGPRFDRPALNEMRKDVKTDAFDVIYFHDVHLAALVGARGDVPQSRQARLGYIARSRFACSIRP
jgi:hypothetical protein